jgi:plastocyanin
MIRRLSLAGVVALIAAWVPAAPAGAGGTCHFAPTPFDARARVVRMKDLCFAPVVVRVPRGAEVTWVNSDRGGEPHTVTGVATQWGSYDELHSGDRVSYSFETEGVWPYFCALHPGMTGAVVVGDGIGNGSAAPATLVPSASGGDRGSAGGDEQGPNTSASAAEASPWPWVGALLAGGAALAVTWSQKRRSREGERAAG